MRLIREFKRRSLIKKTIHRSTPKFDELQVAAWLRRFWDQKNGNLMIIVLEIGSIEIFIRRLINFFEFFYLTILENYTSLTRSEGRKTVTIETRSRKELDQTDFTLVYLENVSRWLFSLSYRPRNKKIFWFITERKEKNCSSVFQKQIIEKSK